jgi:RHS repeat-associated protein
VVANHLTGSIDETFILTDASGPSVFLSDGLRSTLNLADSAGVVQTQYTYGPFGETTITGAVSGNTPQYTGREQDSAHLYYHRARYYEPDVARFISQDPIQFAGSKNVHAYVEDNPINAVDPSGLKLQICSRAAFVSWDPFFNHAYLWNPDTGENCGRGENNGRENPAREGNVCVDIPNSTGHEANILKCCQQKRTEGLFIPRKKDCHSNLDDCIKKEGLANPGAPGGRTGCRDASCIPFIFPDPIFNPGPIGRK